MKFWILSFVFQHDSALMGLFAALGINKTNVDVDGYPLSSTCVTLELWRSADAKFFIKVSYHNILFYK
jgi:hypothetical protein